MFHRKKVCNLLVKANSGKKSVKNDIRRTVSDVPLYLPPGHDLVLKNICQVKKTSNK